MSRQVYHVVWNSAGDAWHLKLQHTLLPISSHKTKEEAVYAGRVACSNLWENRGVPAQLVIHLQNGQIETEYTYGNDPRKSKG